MYRYSYLIANCALFVPWLVLFYARKDVRKAMVWASVLFGFCGLFAEPLYLRDWWHPLTITYTKVGPEDFLFGFVCGGIAAVIYEEVFKKKIKPRFTLHYNHRRLGEFSFALLVILVSINFIIFGFSSFISTVLGFIPAILLIWIKRQDLITDSLMSGLLCAVVGLLWFWTAEIITPGWVKSYWYLDKLSGILVLKAPLEDIIWGFLVGAYVGPLYEFWKGKKLIKNSPALRR